MLLKVLKNLQTEKISHRPQSVQNNQADENSMKGYLQQYVAV